MEKNVLNTDLTGIYLSTSRLVSSFSMIASIIKSACLTA